MIATHPESNVQRWPWTSLTRSSGVARSPGVARGITRGLVLIVLALLALLLSILALWMTGLLLRVRTDEPTTRPATAPASQPALSPAPSLALASEPIPLRDYRQLIRDNYPDADDLHDFPVGVELTDAARLFIKQPAVFCECGNFWFADPRGDDVTTALNRCFNAEPNIARQLPVQVLTWRCGNRLISAALLARDDHALAVTADGRQTVLPIPASAISRMIRVDDWRVILGDHAAYALDPDSMQVVEHALNATEKWDGMVVALPGAIVWSERRAVRFVAGKWVPLFDAPEGSRLIQVVPMRGRTLRLICNNDADEAEIRSMHLSDEPVDDALVEGWVRELSSSEGQRREVAYKELQFLGPGAWPVLERLLEGQPPEARVRMQTLLLEKTEPTIGGFRPRAGPIRVAQRWSDGAIVLRARQGWLRVSTDGERPVTGDLLLVRPGEVPAVAPDDIAELIEAGATLDSIRGEIVARTERGLLRRVGTSFLPVLPARLSDYSLLRGIDDRNRWLIASTRPDAPLLLLDPTIADPTPRLPTWSIPVPSGGVIGKTSDGWPVMRSGDAWALRATGWQLVRQATAWKPVVVDPSKPPTRSLELADGRTRLVMDEPGILRRVKLVDGANRELATHTRGLPADRWPDAMWLDPAGRLVLVCLPDELVIAFPDGRIPREISNLMPVRAGDDVD